MFARDSGWVKVRSEELDRELEAARAADDPDAWIAAYFARLELRGAPDLDGVDADADDPSREPAGDGVAEWNDSVALYCEWFDRGLRCEVAVPRPGMGSLEMELALAAYEAGWMVGCSLLPDRHQYDDGFLRARDAETAEIGSILGHPAWDADFLSPSDAEIGA